MSLRALLVFPVLLCIAVAASAQPVQQSLPQIPLSEAEEGRYLTLLAELRCLVCQNQSLAESGSGLADDLKHEVRSKVAEGQSNEQIKNWLQQRYGDFVLYRPPVKGKTLVLWIGPFVLLIVVLLALLLRMARKGRVESAPEIDQKALSRILDRS